MHTDIVKIAGSFIGVAAVVFIMSNFFSPFETVFTFLLYFLVIAAYGIQLIEWSEHRKFSVFDIDVYKDERIYRQYKIFGIIPISPKKKVKQDISVLDNLSDEQKAFIKDTILYLITNKFVISMIGILLSKGSQNQ